jgi:hypothetical protein
MCLSPHVPPPPPPPAQRQTMKAPEVKDRRTDGALRRRGYAALMAAPRPSLQPPVTTGTLGG